MALNSIYDVGLGATFKRLNALKFPNAESRIRKSMEAPESAKTITVFVNGDSNYSGKKFVVNRKRTPTFDTLLGDVTSGVKAPFGAVRNLYTPVGGTRVLDLAELLTGKTYVASGGARTKFQKIEYGVKPRPRRARSQDPRGKTRDEKALNPVVAQSRFHEFRDLNQKNVIVYANGNSRTPYKFLLKSPRSQNLDHILDDIAIKISKKTGAAIRHMYTTEGKKILYANQVEDGGTYVACGNEKFKQMAYGTNTAPPSIDRQPRARHVPPRLKPVRVVSKDRKPKKSKESENKINKTAKVSRPLPPLEQSHGDDMEIEDDKNTKVEIPIEQRESEEIENNDAENAERLNEEVEETNDVESDGNEDVTEEISVQIEPDTSEAGPSEVSDHQVDESTDGHLVENAPEFDIVQNGSDAASSEEAVEDEPAIEDSADKSLVASVVAAAAITAAKDELIAEDSSLNEDSAEDKPENQSEDKQPEEIAEYTETDNKHDNETQDHEEDKNNQTDEKEIKDETNDVESNDKIKDETDEELDAEKADSPEKDVSGSSEKQEIEYNEVEQKAEEQAEVKQAIETAVNALNKDGESDENPVEKTDDIEEEQDKEILTQNEDIQNDNIDQSVDENVPAEPKTVVQQTEIMTEDSEDLEVTVEDSELNINDNNITETVQPKADILIIETPDVVETNDLDNADPEEPTEVVSEVVMSEAEIRNENAAEVTTEETTNDKVAFDVGDDDILEEPQTPKSDISIAVSVKNEDTEVEISVRLEESKEEDLKPQEDLPTEQALKQHSTDKLAETSTEDFAQETIIENVDNTSVQKLNDDSTQPKSDEKSSDPLGEGQITVNTSENDDTSHLVQETPDKEPIVEEPELSVYQPSSPPKTPNLPIQSSDEFEETKPKTETTDAGLSDAFVTEKAAQRSKSPSGDNQSS